MRLLNAHTLQMQGFFLEPPPPYAVVSHRWGGAELTYQGFLEKRITTGPGYEKIIRCAKIAVERGRDWLWIDTVCIDKTSSAELTEAINSMYDFYRNAVECYAVLPDLTHGAGTEAMREMLRKSAYFTRGKHGCHIDFIDRVGTDISIGWTLQELLAPNAVLFFDSEFEFFAEKHEVADILLEATGIRKKFLEDASLIRTACVAEKMSWMASRKTTKVEDTAYCMMGLFGVHMPLLYGEKEQAFFRLQLQILEHNDDESLFAWISKDRKRTGMLASWPSDFADSGLIRKIPLSPEYRVPWRWGSKGLEVRLLESSHFGQGKNDPLPVGQKSKTMTLGCWRDKADVESADDEPSRLRIANSVVCVLLVRDGTAWQRDEADRLITLSSFDSVSRSANIPLLMRHYYIPQEKPPPTVYFY